MEYYNFDPEWGHYPWSAQNTAEGLRALVEMPDGSRHVVFGPHELVGYFVALHNERLHLIEIMRRAVDAKNLSPVREKLADFQTDFLEHLKTVDFSSFEGK